MPWDQELQPVLRVLVATILGALVGWQRERMHREAGIRTFAAVALGACVFALIAPGDTRIAAQIVTGIGFIGAGVIMRGREHVHGLTTAAALWATASVGTAVAYGRLILGAVVAILLLILLAVPTKKWENETQRRH
ncbi:MAG TPA: MgtC/SapB family protein [Bryobacteraceae bacterium]|nr:MgtC/SapB family protein [Bryobacteraceae bacterium]